MKENTHYRIMVFDDHEVILELLRAAFESRGYEVMTYPHPGTCPILDNESCSCPDGQSCSDIILSDINMPGMRGIDFVEKQIKKGCQCRHLAIMSGDFTPKDLQRVRDLGLKFFEKPFEIAEVFDWLDQVEQNIDPQRQLTEFEELHNN